MIVLDRTRLTVTLAFVRKSTLWKRAFLYWLPGALNILRFFLRVVKLEKNVTIQTWGQRAIMQISCLTE